MKKSLFLAFTSEPVADRIVQLPAAISLSPYVNQQPPPIMFLIASAKSPQTTAVQSKAPVSLTLQSSLDKSQSNLYLNRRAVQQPRQLKVTTSKIELISREETTTQGNSPQPIDVVSHRRVYPVVIKRREVTKEGVNQMKNVQKTLMTQREHHQDAEGVKARKSIRRTVRSSMAPPTMTGITRNSALNKDLEILNSYQVTPAVQKSINLPASRNLSEYLTANSYNHFNKRVLISKNTNELSSSFIYSDDDTLNMPKITGNRSRFPNQSF